MRNGETKMERPWVWRKANAGFRLDSDPPNGGRLFHAYDVNDNCACVPDLGLAASCEPVNEGSALCPRCMTVVRSLPAGRPVMKYGQEATR